MIEYKANFSQWYRRGVNGYASQMRRAMEIAEDNQRAPAATPSSEVQEELDDWVDENYREIVDTIEFLDSSRVKRND